jgi:hypothetical protein
LMPVKKPEVVMRCSNGTPGGGCPGQVWKRSLPAMPASRLVPAPSRVA